MGIRCIALDMDRTTLDARGRLSPGNRLALEAAIARGIHIVIASGRPVSSLPGDVTALPGIEYAITSNGAAVYHLPSGRCLCRRTMTASSVLAVLERVREEPAVLEALVEGQAFADAAYVRDPEAFGATAQGAAYIRATRRPVEDIRAFIRRRADRLDSLDLVVREEAVKLRLWAALQDQVPDLYITSSVPRLLELSHREGGKRAGVCFVARELGLEAAEVAAFGDGDNDAEMLSWAGRGFAVANATAACLAAADTVLPDYRADGVASGIRMLLEE